MNSGNKIFHRKIRKKSDKFKNVFTHHSIIYSNTCLRKVVKLPSSVFDSTKFMKLNKRGRFQHCSSHLKYFYSVNPSGDLLRDSCVLDLKFKRKNSRMISTLQNVLCTKTIKLHKMIKHSTKNPFLLHILGNDSLKNT